MTRGERVEWAVNRITFSIVKALLFYPLMAITVFPAWLYDKLCFLCWKLERWWMRA